MVRYKFVPEPVIKPGQRFSFNTEWYYIYENGEIIANGKVVKHEPDNINQLCLPETLLKVESNS